MGKLEKMKKKRVFSAAELKNIQSYFQKLSIVTECKQTLQTEHQFCHFPGRKMFLKNMLNNEEEFTKVVRGFQKP